MIDGGLRRVTTGETEDLRSVVVADERLPALKAEGIDLYRLWSTAAAPIALPSLGDYPAKDADGRDLVHVSIGVIPAHTLVGSGAAAHIDFDPKGLHKTDSVDVVFVVDGEVTMGVPDGTAIHLKAGESVVQNGALHSWENRSDRPVTMLWMVVRGKR